MLDTDRRSHQRALWTALFVTVLWSSSWVLIRIGLEKQSLPPLTFAGLRYFAAALVLWSWVGSSPARRSEVASINASTWIQLVALGLIFYTVTQGAQFIAIGAQPAATTSLLLAPTPLLVAVLSRGSLEEAVGIRQVGGATLIMVGSVVFFAGDLGATVIGVTAAIVALLANTTSSLLGRSVNRQRRLSPITVTVVSMTFGATLLLTVGLVVEEVPRLEWTALLIVAWLAVVNTAWAFTLGMPRFVASLRSNQRPSTTQCSSRSPSLPGSSSENHPA